MDITKAEALPPVSRPRGLVRRYDPIANQEFHRGIATGVVGWASLQQGILPPATVTPASQTIPNPTLHKVVEMLKTNWGISDSPFIISQAISSQPPMVQIGLGGVAVSGQVVALVVNRDDYPIIFHAKILNRTVQVLPIAIAGADVITEITPFLNIPPSAHAAVDTIALILTVGAALSGAVLSGAALSSSDDRPRLIGTNLGPSPNK